MEVHLTQETFASLGKFLNSAPLPKKCTPFDSFSVPLPSKVSLLDKEDSCKGSSASLCTLSLHHNIVDFLDKPVDVGHVGFHFLQSLYKGRFLLP